MADPSLVPITTPIVLGQPYTLSSLFTFDPGTPPSGDTFLGAVANFFANPNTSFSGTELHIGGDFYRYGITGDTSFVGLPISGDFGSATVTFAAPTTLSGTIQFDDSTPSFPNGFVFADSVSYSFNFTTSPTPTVSISN